MACHVFGAKPRSEPMLAYCYLDPGNIFQWNSNKNTIIFIQENAFENIVCEMAAILSQKDPYIGSGHGGVTVLLPGFTKPGNKTVAPPWPDPHYLWLEKLKAVSGTAVNIKWPTVPYVDNTTSCQMPSWPWTDQQNLKAVLHELG